MAWAPIPYELRIGVTGHRDLERPEAVEDRVRALLQYVVKVLEGASASPLGEHGSPQSLSHVIDRGLSWCLAGCTRIAGRLLPRVSVSPRRPSDQQRTPLKLTVITCLARGADQIVARVVCEMVKPYHEHRERYVEAVLPFAVELYAREFNDERDLRHFRDFLELDRGRTNTHAEPTIANTLFPGALDPADERYTEEKEAAFEAAGQRVVDTSEIVIAIWDPKHRENRGGTAATVRYALNAGRLVLWLNPAELESGPAVLRLIRKDDRTTSSLTKRTDVPDGCRIEDVPSSAKALSRNFHRVAAFNRDGAIDETRLRAGLDRDQQALTAAASESGLPAPVTATLRDTLLPIVVRADHLAMQYRALRQFAARVWPFAAALVVTMMAIQIIFAPRLYWLAFVELAVLVSGFASYRVSLSDDWHGKWLNDRRLAEGLRSAMYAALVRGPVLPTNPLPFYDPSTAWFIASLKRVIAKERRQFERHLPLASASVRRAIVGFLQKAWILDQAAYHERQEAKLHDMARLSQGVRLVMLGLLALIAVLHGFEIGHAEHKEVSWDRVDLWLGVATVALPAWAAAFHVATSLDDHERLAERSHHMHSRLTDLSDQLDGADTVEELVQRVEEAERIMDLESAEWAESLMARRPEFTG